MTTLIGLAGLAQSGKDSAASALMGDGFSRRAFADKIREFLYALNPYLKVSDDPLADMVDYYGWDRAKVEMPEVREVLQKTGVTARQVMGENVWVDATMRDLPDLAVITDVRFPNEVAAIRQRGGIVLRVVRKGVVPLVMADGTIHESETALDDITLDGTLHNNGTIADLHYMVRWWLFHFRKAQDSASCRTTAINVRLGGAK